MYCTLCNTNVDKIIKIKGKEYFLCTNCELLFMSINSRVTKEEERQRYLKHQNDIYDTEYKNFLLKIAEPCFEYINPRSLCLDYGCGNTPNMELIFKEHGFDMESYDPYFQMKKLVGPYDLILCNEVCEHFYNPLSEFRKLKGLLKSEGVLVIGTNMRSSSIDLKTWHYLSDPTHVSIYSMRSFDVISELCNFKVLKMVNDRIIILKAFTLT